jgi:tRNA1(Val) A37 N6-methylase TrmN6
VTALLGGRVRHEQPGDGHRSGIEPVLLAASVPARAGEVVLEGGTGSGAALLCLAARVPGVGGLGLEIDPARAARAAANFAANGFDLLRAEAADLTAWRTDALFDHAMANPPWHPPGTPSPDPARERARRGGGETLADWAASLGRRLRHHGTLTLIVSAAAAPAALAALTAAGCGDLALLPLWPHAGEAARLALVRGRRGGRGPARLPPGLVLHQADGRFTAAAEAILRGGAALPL